MQHRHLLTVLVVAQTLAACVTAPIASRTPAPAVGASPPPAVSGVQGPGQATSATPGPPADDDLNAVLWTQRAVEHDLVCREIYRNAEDKLLAAIVDPTWDALSREERAGPVADLPPAVIVDIDETVLDNSPYQARLVMTGEEYDDYSWGEWCRKEEATALPGALEFARFAAEHGVTLFYLTNRAVDLGPATLDNLRKAGFPVPDDTVFLGLGVVVKGCETVGSDKGCRRRLVASRYRVLMQFGDQIGDFVDVSANTPDGREKAVAPYLTWIGERWWVLPNPSYGSWEPACFDNDWTLSREQRRKAKIDSLRPY